MAHSVFQTRISNQIRNIWVSDGLASIYFHLFLDGLQDMKEDDLGDRQREIFDSYKRNLRTDPWSCYNDHLNTVIDDTELSTWYLDNLKKLAELSKSHGDEFSIDFLHHIGPSGPMFTMPVKTQLIFDLINDVKWLLHVENIRPSESLKWVQLIDDKDP